MCFFPSTAGKVKGVLMISQLDSRLCWGNSICSGKQSREKKKQVELKKRNMGLFLVWLVRQNLTLTLKVCFLFSTTVYQLMLCLAIKTLPFCVLEHKSQAFVKPLTHSYATHHTVSLIAILLTICTLYDKRGAALHLSTNAGFICYLCHRSQITVPIRWLWYDL